MESILDFTKKNIYKILTFTILIGITLFSLFLLPYGFGNGNQGEIIPIHNRLEDPDYLKNDKFVNQQMEYNVRTNFAYIIYATKQLAPQSVGYPGVYLGFFIISSFLTYLGILRISNSLVGNRWLALAVTIIYAMLPNIAIGGVSVITTHLLPSSFATVFVVWGLSFFLTKQEYKMAVFLGLSLYMHVLVGLLASCAILASYFFCNYKNQLAKAVKICFLWLLLSLPALLPQFLSSSSSLGGDSKQIAYIIGFFRNPHHYIPSTWDSEKTLLFFAIEILSLICLFFVLRKKKQQLFYRFVWIFVALNIMYFCGYFFVEVITLAPFLKLQLFRISILSDLLAKLIIIASSVILLKNFLSNLELSQNWRKRLLVTTVVLITVISIIARLPKLHDSININPVTAASNQAAYDWVTAHTPSDSVFLAPIGERDIRLQMNRSLAANLKQFVFKDSQVLEWYEGIKDFCGMEEPQCKGWACAKYCDSEFSAYSEEQILFLAKKYQADYLITTRSEPLEFDLVYKDAKYSIYKLSYE